MKRTVTKLISLLLVMVMCFAMLPLQAFGWGKMTHVYTANEILRTALSRGSVEYEGKSFDFTVPEEFRDAISSYPDAFRAGALGPDVYPDILTGQMYIHPADANIDSGMWVTYLCDAVNKMGKDTESRKVALSFTLGCILHYCGDLFGHDFVNTFSGGAFPSIASTEMLDLKSERLNNVVSHLAVESYMDALIYPSYSASNGKIDAPNFFVQNTMVFNGSPAAGLATPYRYYPELRLQDIDTGDIWLISDILDNILDGLYDNGTNNVPPHYTAMAALRRYISKRADKYRENMEPISAGITRFYDEWAEDVDKGIAKFIECSDNIASRMVTKEKNPLIEKKKEEELESEHNYFINLINHEAEEKALASGVTQEELDWLKEQSTLGIDGESLVDEIMRELIRDGVVTQEMLNKSDSSIMIIKEELGYWWDEYGIYMLGIPDIMIDGIEIPIIGDIVDLVLLGPVWDLIMQEIKKLIADEIVEACTGWVGKATGLSNAEVGQAVSSIVSKVNDRLEDPRLQLDHEDNPFQPSEHNFMDLNAYMKNLSEKEYDKFEALNNTLTMFKLVLMGPDNYSNFVQQYASTQQTAYQKNIGHVEASALELTFKTSDLYQAGTDDNIYVTVYEVGPGGGLTRVAHKLLDKSGSNDFEAGDEERYTVELGKAVKLEKIAVSLSKTPAFDFLPSFTDDWSCESITVLPLYSGNFAIEAYIQLGGVKLQGIWKNVDMQFAEALEVKGNETPQTLPVTNLQVKVQVEDVKWAGSDSDIYMVARYGNELWAKVCLDKPGNNDLERGETETYNIPITYIDSDNRIQGIPLNELTLEIKHEGIDGANWKSVEVTPCYGKVPLIENKLTFGGKQFENATWSLGVQNRLKNATYAQYKPIEYEYETCLDDGLLYFMDSLDGGEEWMDVNNELWNNRKMREDIFLRLFKGFTPKIEYTGEDEFLKGAEPVVELEFAGQWNGVSMERRTQVKDFEHKAPVEGSAIIEIFDEKSKCVYTAENVPINDEKIQAAIPTSKLKTGVYDVQVTYQPDSDDPLYGRTVEIFEDAFKFEIGPLTITEQPQDAYGEVGKKVEFTLEVAGGSSPYSYCWQVKKNNGAWTDADASWSVGYNYKPFGFLAAADQFTADYKYRCIITDEAGASVTSDEVTVLKLEPLVITKQPVDVTAGLGEEGTVTVEASGGVGPYKYVWQLLRNGEWIPVPAVSNYSGLGTNSLTMVTNNAGEITLRCEVIDDKGTIVDSEQAKITVKELPLTVMINDGEEKHTISYIKNENIVLKANARGGVPPYTFTWYEIGFDEKKLDYDWIPVKTGSSYEVGPWSSHEIRLEVKDSKGNTAWASVWIEVIDKIN